MSDVLLGLPRFATDGRVALKPGFDRIRALLDALGSPEKTYRTILVAGTNGKGSVASMLSALMTASGLRAGLHTSPHLVSITERMRVDGRPAPDTWLNLAVEAHRDDLARIGPSFFEATLAFSLAWFAEQRVDVAVVEVGLGGRLDATNVLDADVSVITSIGLDHTDILGDSLAAIAREKAGIAKHGRPLIVGRLPEPARNAVVDVALQAGAQLVSAEDFSLPDGLRMDLLGTHQMDNARVAIVAAGALLDTIIRDEIVRDAMAHVCSYSGLRARMEQVGSNPAIFVDVAHNPDAVATALTALAALDGLGSSCAGASLVNTVVLGMLSDKDAMGVGREIAARSPHLDVWTVPTSGSRGQSAADLAGLLQPVLPGAPRVLGSVREALDCVRKEGRNTLFIGSHQVAADVIGVLEG